MVSLWSPSQILLCFWSSQTASSPGTTMPPYGASSIGETSFSPEQFTWMQGGNVMGCRSKIALQSILVHTPSDLHLQILPGSIVEHTHASSGDKNLHEGIRRNSTACQKNGSHFISCSNIVEFYLIRMYQCIILTIVIGIS